MAGVRHRVGTEVRLGHRPPADALQAEHLPSRQAAEAHQASALAVVAVEDLAYVGVGSTADIDTVLPAFHRGAVLVVRHAPEHCVAAHDDRRAAVTKEGVDGAIGLLGPVLAVPVDHDDPVSLELERVTVEVVVARDIVLIAALVQPPMREQLPAH